MDEAADKPCDQKKATSSKEEPLSLKRLLQLVDSEFDLEETVFQFSSEDKKEGDDVLFLPPDVDLLPEVIESIRLLPPEGRRELYALFAQIDGRFPTQPTSNAVRKIHVPQDFEPLQALQAQKSLAKDIRAIQYITCANESCPNKVAITRITSASKLMRPICDACSHRRSKTPPI
jgi:hypothetical protein